MRLLKILFAVSILAVFFTACSNENPLMSEADEMVNLAKEEEPTDIFIQEGVWEGGLSEELTIDNCDLTCTECPCFAIVTFDGAIVVDKPVRVDIYNGEDVSHSYEGVVTVWEEDVDGNVTDYEVDLEIE